MNEPMPPAIARLIDEFGIDAPVDYNRLMLEFERDNAERTCVGCGCTNARACIHPSTGEPCSWVEGTDVNICSFCAEIALAMADAEEADVDCQRMADPRVQLYSEGQANAAIRSMRAGGAL